jgi:hypothetical protein
MQHQRGFHVKTLAQFLDGGVGVIHQNLDFYAYVQTAVQTLPAPARAPPPKAAEQQTRKHTADIITLHCISAVADGA